MDLITIDTKMINTYKYNAATNLSHLYDQHLE